MFKKFFPLSVTILFICTFPNASGTASENTSGTKASDLIRIEVIRDGVPFRDQPSNKGKIIQNGFVDEDMDMRTDAYADPNPVNKEGASWYKVQFIYDAQVIIRYNLPYLYVNTKDVRKVPSSSGDKNFLEQFDRGRTPLFSVGDNFEKLRKLSAGNYRSAKTKIPLKLYREPNKNSKTFMLPAGTSIIDPTDWAVFYLCFEAVQRYLSTIVSQ